MYTTLAELDSEPPRTALSLQAAYLSCLPLFARDRECAASLRQFFERRREEFERLGLNVDALLARLPIDDGLAVNLDLWPSVMSVRALGLEPYEPSLARPVSVEQVCGQAPVEFVSHHGRQKTLGLFPNWHSLQRRATTEGPVMNERELEELRKLRREVRRAGNWHQRTMVLGMAGFCILLLMVSCALT